MGKKKKLQMKTERLPKKKKALDSLQILGQE